MEAGLSSTGSGKVTKGGYDDDLVRAASIAREECKTALEEGGLDSREKVLDVLRRRRVGWVAIDPEFNLEISMTESLCYSGSEARVCRKILMYMPSAVKLVDVEAADQAVAWVSLAWGA